MKHIHIITPVKDNIDSTLETVRAIQASVVDVPYTYILYNDFSTSENTRRLEDASREMGFNLVNLSDITSHPSPNYLLVLRRERHACLEEESALIIVESDVVVRPDTIQGLWNAVWENVDVGIMASVTVDEENQINYPYEYVKKWSEPEREKGCVSTRRHCSFCCSLLTPELLKRIDFDMLDETKNWFDVTISHRSLEQGLKNYVLTSHPVVHRPHGSRPWKKLKYTNPLKYYWRKLIKGFDRI